ncbi:MAG TPA: hypothetical protein VF988_02540 [Verrucomicrobiae bacterium]
MKQGSRFLLLAALGWAVTASADPTALQLVAKGNDYVGVQSKDRVVMIMSEKSAGTLTPAIWHIVYFDPDAPFKTVDVKFGGGEEMQVAHPVHPFQVPAKDLAVLDRSKIQVDSDRALEIATGQPLLRPFTLRAAKLTLEHNESGLVWKVQLWAAKLRDPNKEADVGTVTLSATDGTVLKADLHPGRAD